MAIAIVCDHCEASEIRRAELNLKHRRLHAASMTLPDGWKKLDQHELLKSRVICVRCVLAGITMDDVLLEKEKP